MVSTELRGSRRPEPPRIPSCRENAAARFQQATFCASIHPAAAAGEKANFPPNQINGRHYKKARCPILSPFFWRTGGRPRASIFRFPFTLCMLCLNYRQSGQNPTWNSQCPDQRRDYYEIRLGVTCLLEHFRNTRRLFKSVERWIFLEEKAT